MNISLFKEIIKDSDIDKEIIVSKNNIIMSNTNYFYIFMKDDNDKFEMFLTPYKKFNISKTIIYCKPETAPTLYSKLTFQDFTSSIVQKRYDKSINKIDFEKFKSGKTRILVSDYSIDVKIAYLSLIIYYDIEFTFKDLSNNNFYHNTGNIITFVKNNDKETFMNNIEENMLPFETLNVKDLSLPTIDAKLDEEKLKNDLIKDMDHVKKEAIEKEKDIHDEELDVKTVEQIFKVN